MTKTQEHWDQVYSAKNEDELSWYEAHPEHSLSLIRSAAPDISASILDVGGGVSRFIDALLALGYSDLTVFDVSKAALDHSKERLGKLAERVSWITADITQWSPLRTWDVWHDRAVFHFLTSAKDQDTYIATLESATKPGSVAIIATFALDGPERCSGLPVQRYSPATLKARIGEAFELVSEASQSHSTPWGSVQKFAYSVLKRR